ncbi:SRPBCC family protein [Moorena sp. SIO4G3]|uniref:aromatic ring-hydroxylating oxygenase subunit alpha n=1 Tax=Moorena sp. SIO4G3 TaxID=2607821 RepID=UPI00142A2F3E|nr:SRPBCC family protein [Moorena sp. SIO4G3]NEO79450.1 Rieske 2Fe-2S domain-containing protein [Moorena sp. SIO4G3]
MLSLAHEFYFYEEIFALEQKRFQFQDIFLGHSGFVKESQNYFVLPHTNDTKVLIHNGENIQVLSNICKHRYAILLKDKGHCRGIVCPMHSWSYDLNGKILNSPGIECDHALHSLERESIDIYDGFLFPENFSALKGAIETAKTFTNINFEKLNLFAHDRFFVKVNWKSYMDTFLDNYHLEAFHPNFRTFLDSRHIESIFRDDFSVQGIRIREKPQIKTPALQAYVDCYRKYVGPFPEDYGAIWLCIYPNIIIEISQCFALIAIVIPESIDSCSIYEYRLVEEQFSQHQDFLSAFDQYMYEIEYEDHDLMTSINQGRKALYQQGHQHYGPYHPTKEAGQQQFHDYIRRMIPGSPNRTMLGDFEGSKKMDSPRMGVVNQ